MATRSTQTSARKNGARTRVQTPQDAVSFLMSQHREVEALFKQFEKLGENGSNADKEVLVRDACAKLTVHATIEEEIFYPAAREVKGTEALLNEAEVEHGTAKDLIATLQGMEGGEDMFDANVKVLSEYIKHHVKEEEDELFPKVKKSDLDLESLGQELQTRSDELTQPN